MHIAIIGAGVSGISTAWQLTQRFPDCRVTLIDKRQPGTLCSNKGTEAFRNFWPGDTTEGMFVKQLELSVRALKDFATKHSSMELKKNGYAFFSEKTQGNSTIHEILATQERNFSCDENNYEYIQEESILRARFPSLAVSIKSALIMHNCGWFRTKEYLKSMLYETMAGRFSFVSSDVKIVEPSDSGIRLGLDDKSFMFVDKIILCTGQETGALLSQIDLGLPLRYEAHSRAVFPDLKRRLHGMPFSFFSDPFAMSFTENELTDNPALNDFHGLTLNGHFHARENWEDTLGRASLLALWTYDCTPELEVNETIPNEYVTILYKGLQKLFPDYSLSSDSLSNIPIHTGIYTKMPDNMPCIGSLIDGRVYINSALSGYGFMFSQQASRLIADHCVEAMPVPAIFNPLRQGSASSDFNTHLRGQM